MEINYIPPTKEKKLIKAFFAWANWNYYNTVPQKVLLVTEKFHWNLIPYESNTNLYEYKIWKAIRIVNIINNDWIIKWKCELLLQYKMDCKWITT